MQHESHQATRSGPSVVEGVWATEWERFELVIRLGRCVLTAPEVLDKFCALGAVEDEAEFMPVEYINVAV